MTRMYEVWFYDHGEKILYGTFIRDMAENIALRLIREKNVRVALIPA